MNMINSLISGLSLGSVYSIIALGYTMVYGISKMLNFAHGDIIMVGSYISFCLTTYVGMPGWAALIGAVAVCTVLGIVIERLAYRPLRGTGSLSVLITAIGVSYFLQNMALLVWGANPRVFKSLFKGLEPIRLAEGQIIITAESFFTIIVCVVIMVGLTLFVHKSKAGKAMRAVSEDNGAAQLMGINVNQSISLTFAIGSGLAAVAGVLMCSAYPVLMPTTGAMPGIKAFTAAVLGGIGSIPGAMVGGLILGTIEIFSRAYISTELSDAIVFACLVIVLLVKPTGLFGKKISEKV
ncbi:MAG: branched-chain amino acid ABC transporter permease [Clostridiales bacterium]|nr:branched-chain amino acid ABC transporter permease [Clostridiales bacterium]